ncbi:MAG: class I SAM-dependent methyltransferase [Rhodospirillaceae bacterium]|nr:class I SAM-dependent methyltransferase [Rhodospirillaceae bacterium]MBL6930636.1 class I SAM-dependent methyltransferase [Rhodospirillales bacterium]
MAGSILNMGGSIKSPGKVRALLGKLFDMIGQFLHLKKGQKKSVSKDHRSAREKPKADDETTDDDFQPAALWPPERLNIIEKLWGEGCTSPGSADFLRVMLPLLGLSEKKSLLMLGAGLGGLGRAMVDETGVWVTGLEADEELAALGKDMTRMAGMQKRAPVTLSNLEQPKLKENSFNAVVSLESLYRVAAKEQLYTAMVAALRGEGELMMTDFVKADDEPASDIMKAWAGREPTPPHLWTADAIQSFLQTMNLDVRPYENITAQYRAGVFKGFFNYLSGVTKSELLEISGDLINECEYWAKQLTAIDSGGLKVYRFHAFKLPDKHKKTI